MKNLTLNLPLVNVELKMIRYSVQEIMVAITAGWMPDGVPFLKPEFPTS